LLHEFTHEAYLKALSDVDRMREAAGLRERLRSLARAEFDLIGIGRVRYRRLYDRLVNRN
jgi:hypothetical protein